MIQFFLRDFPWNKPSSYWDSPFWLHETPVGDRRLLSTPAKICPNRCNLIWLDRWKKPKNSVARKTYRKKPYFSFYLKNVPKNHGFNPVINPNLQKPTKTDKRGSPPWIQGIKYLSRSDLSFGLSIGPILRTAQNCGPVLTNKISRCSWEKDQLWLSLPTLA